MGSWSTVELGQLATVHKEQIDPQALGDEFVHHYSIPSFDFIQRPALEPAAAIKSSKFTVPPDSVLVSKLNPRFPRVWCPNVSESVTSVASTEFVVLRPLSGVDRRFLAYLCQSPSFRSQLEGMVTGTSGSHQRVRARDLLSVEVTIPPIGEQRAIADLLGAFDDKIALNRRMNETLEAIARAIFKSWFVDFDPVRAKMSGREPTGMNAEVAALFPDSLVRSAIGEIPAGWAIGSMRDLLTLSRESILPRDFPNEVFDHYSIPAFDEGQRPARERGFMIRSIKFVVRGDAVLLSKLNPRFPRVWLPYPESDRPAIASTEFLVATPRAGYSREYVYSLFQSDQFMQRFSGLVTGTSGSHQRVKREDFLEMPVVLPNHRVVEAFSSGAAPLFRAIAANVRQSEILAACRDELLPNLLGGKLTVREGTSSGDITGLPAGLDGLPGTGEQG